MICLVDKNIYFSFYPSFYIVIFFNWRDTPFIYLLIADFEEGSQY
jgi:hypothetical protein